MEDAVIVSALRTPVGSFGGQFKDIATTRPMQFWSRVRSDTARVTSAQPPGHRARCRLAVRIHVGPQAVTRCRGFINSRQTSLIRRLPGSLNAIRPTPSDVIPPTRCMPVRICIPVSRPLEWLFLLALVLPEPEGHAFSFHRESLPRSTTLPPRRKEAYLLTAFLSAQTKRPVKVIKRRWPARAIPEVRRHRGPDRVGITQSSASYP